MSGWRKRDGCAARVVLLYCMWHPTLVVLVAVIFSTEMVACFSVRGACALCSFF